MFEPPTKMITVGAQQLRIAVRKGAEPGPPLVLCNGIGASIEALEPFVAALDPRIEVISFDVPGVGGSPEPRRPYRFTTVARMLGKLLDQLGHGSFDVLGISWGGGLAQQVALMYPRRCRRVVLVSTATGSLMVPARLSVLSKMVTPRRYRDPDYARDVAGTLYGGRLRAEPELAARLLQGGRHLGSRRGYLLQLLAGAGWTSLPLLPSLRQPTLILAGRDDPLIPLANARIMARLLPAATLYIYEDGHLGLMTSASELAPRVAQFLRDDPLSAPAAETQPDTARRDRPTD